MVPAATPVIPQRSNRAFIQGLIRVIYGGNKSLLDTGLYIWSCCLVRLLYEIQYWVFRLIRVIDLLEILDTCYRFVSLELKEVGRRSGVITVVIYVFRIMAYWAYEFYR